MPLLDFLNHATFQDHPLTGPVAAFSGGLEIKRTWLLDAGFTLHGVEAYDFAAGLNLVQIASDGTDVTFVFLAGETYFTFVVPVTASYGYTAFNGARLTAGGSEHYEIGSGFLQVGELAELATPGTWTGSARVEPGLVRAAYRHQVRTLNVANAPATVDRRSCDTSSSSSSSGQEAAYIVEATGLDGDILLDGGYFTTVDLSVGANSLTVNVAADAESGATDTCDPHSLLVYPEGYDPLAVVQCKDLIYTIDGLGPDEQTRAFRIEGAYGVEVTPAPEQHAIFVEVDYQALFAVPRAQPECGEPSSSSSNPSSSSGGGGSSSSTGSSSSSSTVPSLPYPICSSFSWATGTTYEPLQGGDNDFRSFSPTGTVDTSGKTAIRFNGSSDDIVVLIHSSDTVTQTYSGVEGDPVTVTLPAEYILIRDSYPYGYIIAGTGFSCEKTVTDGTLTHTFPAGSPSLAGTGHVQDMEASGFETRAWGDPITVAELTAKGWLSGGVFSFKVVHIVSGSGFANVTSVTCQ
jgi:hypothetical protein